MVPTSAPSVGARCRGSATSCRSGCGRVTSGGRHERSPAATGGPPALRAGPGQDGRSPPPSTSPAGRWGWGSGRPGSGTSSGSRSTIATGPPPALDVDLGERLARRFRLSRAIVVEVDGDILDGDRSPDLAAADRASDEIHRQLGRAAGEFLYQFVNGEHDTVAVGAGRGVHFTIRTLREQVEEHARRGVDWRSFPSSAPCGCAPIHSTSGPGSTSTPTRTRWSWPTSSRCPWSQVHLAWLPRLYLVGDVAEKAQVIA